MTVARPTIKDPRLVPIVGCDGHLPAVAADRLTAPALRARFAALPSSWLPEFRGDGVLFTGHGPSLASVLVGLVHGPDESLRVLLTQRTAHLSKHAGQISFPGGRREDTDADAVATALREAQEEIGLDPAGVEVLGTMPTYTTVTHFTVTPVVAIVERPAAYRPDPHEVESVFEVPLVDLMSPDRHQRHRYQWEGQSRDFLAMPWHDAEAGTERFIWGATAAMLRNLYRLLAA